MHLGNLRTALLAWCFARSQAAHFLLRIEDLDRQRSRREHDAAIVADLARLGIDWDGAPVRQSERLERHRECFEELRSSGRLYPCWCARAEIRDAGAAPHPPLPGARARRAEGVYPGTCRTLSSRERSRLRRGGAPNAWRLDAGAQRVRFVDRLAGDTAAVVDDFVLWRGEAPRRAAGDDPAAGGAPSYNLAVVVDDSDQGIGEVVRGDDLLETTPRQILLAQLLDLPLPSYAHVPLVLGPDGQRLAKRHGAVTLTERLERGESIETVVGWMAASAGLAPAGSSLSAQDVLATFDPRRIRSEPAVFSS